MAFEARWERPGIVFKPTTAENEKMAQHQSGEMKGRKRRDGELPPKQAASAPIGRHHRLQKVQVLLLYLSAVIARRAATRPCPS